MSAPTRWWQTFFDDDFADLVLDHDDANAVRRTLLFFEEELRIAPGVRVLDQCCGTGRLAIPLARAGACVAGVDVVPRYIERARARALAEGLASTCELHCMDAASFVPASSCDAAFNWWTSFGFDEDDRTSKKMLERAHESLVPKGRFALDYPNVPRVLAELEMEMRTTRETSRGPVTIIRRSHVDETRATLEQEWSYVFADGRTKRASGRTRLHRPADIARMFEEARFTIVALYGDVDRSPIDASSPRCIVVGEAVG
jgi:SAM-dependent methyltransferase